MDRVKDKVVVVTGGASDPSLGRTTALTLAAEGAKVVVTDIDDEGGENCAQAIRDGGGEAIFLHHDVVNEDEWKAVIERTVDTFGRLDVLVNNAGIAVLKPIEDLTLADWDRQISVNLTSVFLGCKYGVEAMRKYGGGSIVNLSSVAGLVGLSNCIAYGASKGGVRLMTKSIAVECGPDNIRCNSVHPGVIWTNMQAQARQAEAETPPEDYPLRDSIPLGRMGEPQDIANVILYLASDESNYVSGAEFTVDAGMTAK